MPNEDKQYLVVRNPDEDEAGAYYLIVDKNEGAFGQSSQIIYSVDLVQVKDGVVSAHVYDTGANGRVTKLVAQFPERMNYLLILKNRAEFLSPEEVADYNSRFGKRLREAMKKHREVEPEEVDPNDRGFTYL